MDGTKTWGMLIFSTMYRIDTGSKILSGKNNSTWKVIQESEKENSEMVQELPLDTPKWQKYNQQNL